MKWGGGGGGGGVLIIVVLIITWFLETEALKSFDYSVVLNFSFTQYELLKEK